MRTTPTSQTVDICVCTFRRPEVVDTLRSLMAQDAPGLTLRVIVADNDGHPSAQARVESIAEEASFPIVYVHAPERNISIARNACLDAATAEWLAFIDDDETATEGWIASLFAKAAAERRDVVFGPVLALYPEDTPDWIRAGDYLSARAPVHRGVVSTGHSGNVLMRWRDSPWMAERFLLSKGRTGGEDVEFFFRLFRIGASLGVCEAAIAYEAAPLQRLTYQWIHRRRFLAGQFHGTHSGPSGKRSLHRAKLIASSSLKAAYCAVRAAISVIPGDHGRREWSIRCGFHLGVCAGALGLGAREQY